LGALAATLAELSNIPIDDNITIPIFSALVMTLLSIVI
jgi:dolichol kinase